MKEIKMRHRKLIRHSVAIASLALTSIWPPNVGAALTLTYVAAPQESVRYNAPVTRANSVLFDFGYGAILRVPKALLPAAVIPKDPNKAIEAQTLSMVFQFPDMTPAVWEGQMHRVFDEQAGNRHVPQPDRFPVFVQYMFYSPGDMGIIKSWEHSMIALPEWRPPSQLQHSEIIVGLGLNGAPPPVDWDHALSIKPKIADSKYEGLRDVLFPIDQAYHDRAAKYWKERSMDSDKMDRQPPFIERENDPYELYMICDQPDSFKCEAHVYDKNSHFQYRMMFPVEAVAHTDQLIRTINKMIDGWIQK
jgi:hypothetical protein